MTPELEIELDKLNGLVQDAHFSRLSITTLYSHNDERVELLKLTAPGFFGTLRSILIRDLVLAVARLGDKQQSHLSLYSLPRLLKGPELADLKSMVEHDIELFERAAASAKEYRNNVLAHTDKRVALGDKPSTQSELSFGHLTSCLTHASDAINHIYGHYDRPHVMHAHGVLDTKSVPALLNSLKLGATMRDWISQDRASWQDIWESRWASA